MAIARFTWDILDDGTNKIETDEIAPALHKNADEMLKLAEDLLGGEVTIEQKKKHAHAHQHVQQKAKANS